MNKITLKSFLLQMLMVLLAMQLTNCGKRAIHPVEMEYTLRGLDDLTIQAYRGAHNFLRDCIQHEIPVKAHPRAKIDTILVDQTAGEVDIYLTAPFGYIPLRKSNVDRIYKKLATDLGKKFQNYKLKVYAGAFVIEDLIPNFYRKDVGNLDGARRSKPEKRGAPIVRNLNAGWQPAAGLYNRNIALWPSHGWYYEPQRQRWEWQRARIFQTVEDLLPMSFVIPYLIPMLENAGALVFQPRERDLQTNEVIVDNDWPDSLQQYLEFSTNDSIGWQTGKASGFAIGSPPYVEGANPFKSGSYRYLAASQQPSAEIQWIPRIPETGEYWISIAYQTLPQSVTDARYTVYHSGGKTEFLVNQQMGGGTWIYLGKFKFREGRHPEIGKVVLSNASSAEDGIITADAVRFGGGMGNVSRAGQISGRPRYMEGARYYMQFAGIPDTLVYNVTENPDGDYKDDYRGRGEWVNYLKGSPFGPNKQRTVEGLKIPIDLSLAFHTDAGATQNDTTIGTLMIYSVTDKDSNLVFPDGVSRLANRDFGDVMQTQIVSDLQTLYDPAWTRRFLWDARYSEAFRLNMPAVLLELLSHHNYQDMKYALDPRFRFDASRSIYKSMGRFLAIQNDQPFIVQPLPVTHFSAEFVENSGVKLSWQPASDPLEPTAEAAQYLVYTRIEDGGFDNGKLAEQPEFLVENLQDSLIYSFKITAVNDGGESFPSEILSVCRMGADAETVLIVNGFDRISGPATLEADNLRGFADFIDEGVPDKYDLNYIGSQFNFTAWSKWTNDESPGHGASHADFETKILPGNTFDFPYIHGQSIRAAGYSFISCSDEAVEDSLINIASYPAIDLIFGEEKTTDWPKPVREKQFQVFTPGLQQQLRRYLNGGGHLFLSGAHIGTDLYAGKGKKHKDEEYHPDVIFGKDVLKFYWRTNHAAKTGAVNSVDTMLFKDKIAFEYNAGYHPQIYKVEAPDALIPAAKEAFSIFRYSENNVSAGIAYAGDYRLVALGFPFETIVDTSHRNTMMAAILDFLLD